MNASVVPEASVKFKSVFPTRDEKWIFYENFSVSGQIDNLWMDEISQRTITSNSGKLSG